MGSHAFLVLLVFTLLVFHKRAVSADDSPGFHGYERDALLAIKAVFNSAFLDKNWSTGLMCYMNDPPYWFGVQCYNGRVTGLVLENLALVGEIKGDVLFNLTELEGLSLRNNSISGDMMDFGNNWKLRSIDLSENKFSGEISPSLLNLSSLESLQLQNNDMNGSIPAFNQSTLNTFNVSHNNLSGPIPETKTLQSFPLSSYSGNENLCGPPLTTACKSANDSSYQNHKHGDSGFMVILIAADVIVLIVILFLLIIYYNKYKKLKKEMRTNNLLPKRAEHDSTIVDRSMAMRTTPETGNKGNLVFVENNGDPTFELDDLLKASAEGLGKGNFGNCYKALLEVGGAVVVKRLKDLKPLNSEEFMRQVRAIAEQKHRNLLPLLAFYYSKEEKLFLYKCASHGNLQNRLHGGRGTRERVPFRWNSRLAVARGVGRALKHLHFHTRSQTTAPHGNLKSSNVLLDDSDEVLVTDYGLTSLIVLPIVAQRMVAYKCPEYIAQKKISKKSDIWSYGALLLELLTGRIPAHSAPSGVNGVDLCGWVHRAVREEWTAEIFDPEIVVQRGANQGMLRLMQIAMRCCEKAPENRPEIDELLAEVEEIKVTIESEDEDYSYSSLDRSLTDDSASGSMSIRNGDEQK